MEFTRIYRALISRSTVSTLYLKPEQSISKTFTLRRFYVTVDNPAEPVTQSKPSVNEKKKQKKGATSLTPEQLKRARTVMKLHLTNKEMFGGLIETKHQKVAREQRQKLLRSEEDKEISNIDFHYDVDTIPRRRKDLPTLPSAQNVKTIAPEGARDSVRDHVKGKLAETEWILKGNPKLMKVRTGSIDDEYDRKYHKVIQKTITQFSADIEIVAAAPVATLGQSRQRKRKELSVEPESCNQHEKNEVISIPFSRSLIHSSLQQDEYADENVELNQFIPSVSKILNASMSEEQAKILERWQTKMISELGEEGFRLYKENILNNGKLMHSCIESYLRGTPINEISVEKSISGHWRSLTNILPSVKNVKVIESHVVHKPLGYCGIIDCVAFYQNRLVLIDWKTSQKQKPFVSMTYDTPLQIAAYIGAINVDPNYSLKINDGLIVIAYEDGRIGQTFLLSSSDLETYWKQWLERLQTFKLKFQNS